LGQLGTGSTLPSEVAVNVGQTQFARLNSALADLYLQSPRISELLGTYEAHPSLEAWKSIKTRARANEEKLIKLYNIVESLASRPFFDGNRHLHDEIQTVVKAESVRFYSEMRCFPEAPIPTDHGWIHDLVEHARRLDHQSAEAALEFQQAASAYLHRTGENWDSGPTISH
jgi:hypothetical protein